MSRTKQKVKSKKKGKSKKGKDEWTLDGGQSYEDTNSQDKYQRYGSDGRKKTQLMDDKKRRIKRMMINQSMESKVQKKLIKGKVSFADILNQDNNIEEEEEELRKEPISKKKVKQENVVDSVEPKLPSFILPKLPGTNQKAWEQLQLSLRHDQSNKNNSIVSSLLKTVSSTGPSLSSTSEYDTTVANASAKDRYVSKNKNTTLESDLVTVNSNINHPPNVITQISATSEIQDVEGSATIEVDLFGDENDVDDDENDVDDDLKEGQTATSSYQCFFAPLDSRGAISTEPEKKFKPIALTHDLNGKYELVASLNKPQFLKPLVKLGDLPGLPKLWRSRESTRVESQMEQVLLPYMNSYMDAFIERTGLEDGDSISNENSILSAMLTHTITHTVRARIRVMRNNYKLKKRMDSASLASTRLKTDNTMDNGKKPKKGKALKSKSPAIVVEPSVITHYTGLNDFGAGSTSGIQDQGFVRPRVLIMCPFRSSARVILEQIIEILGENTTISNLTRFYEEFGNNFELSEKEGVRPKPQDYQNTFYDNMDDDFKFGIQINPGQGKGAGVDKGVYMRLFSDFYSSDIIIASPIGLKLIMENNESAKLSYDFLSSIEIAIIHQADILYMQNWEHVEFVMNHCNKLPVTDHDTDYSRVHPYFLEQQSHMHRQVLVSSYFNEPIIQSFFRTHANSHMGGIKLRKVSADGCVSRIHLQVAQVFQKIQCSSYQTQDDEKFQYFCDKVLTQILRLNQTRTLIVTPSYFSYVRLRNELIKREADAAFICEYSRESEISRGRSRFFHGQKKIMLYSGRAHFFRRFELRGCMHVVFYGIPEYPHHYPEIVNLLREADQGGLSAEMSTVLLFSQFERMALERLVGKERCLHILESKKSTFIFK